MYSVPSIPSPPCYPPSMPANCAYLPPLMPAYLSPANCDYAPSMPDYSTDQYGVENSCDY